MSISICFINKGRRWTRGSDLDGRVDPHLGLSADPCGRGDSPLEHFDAVLLAEEAAVDQVVPVARHQLVVALDAREALDVVDVALGSHHVLGGHDHLAATAARRAAEHPGGERRNYVRHTES